MKTVSHLLGTKNGGLALKSISPNISVLEALEILKAGNYGAVPVIDPETGGLVGILSESDYARKVEILGRMAGSTRVAEIMTQNPICVSVSDTLEHCMSLMTHRGFRHLPVMDGTRAIGIISIKDLVKTLLSDKDALIEEALSIGDERQRTLELEAESRLKRFLEGINRQLSSPDVTLERVREFLSATGISQASTEKKAPTRVLLANENPHQQVVTRMALAGTGSVLDSAETLEQGAELIEKNDYDVICVNSTMIPLTQKARQKNPSVKSVFVTSEDAEAYLARLREHPEINNVVSHGEGDRVLTVKSILATVSKIVSGDFFGMEKYLSWGADIRERRVKSSEDRSSLIAEMSEFLQNVGLRRQQLTRCSNVAEELLMNAIYDAPTDASGKPIYNHLQRTVPVELTEEQQAVLRYGTDGMFLGISVRDPFGSIRREVVLSYLESCFKGEESPLHKDKGGGGHGLFTLLRSAHLTVFNVKPGVATEVIALFDLEPPKTATARTSSFHYFGS